MDLLHHVEGHVGGGQVGRRPHLGRAQMGRGDKNQVYVVKEPEGVEGGRRRCSRTQGR